MLSRAQARGVYVKKLSVRDIKDFFCPTNKLLQAVEGEAMTINEFFGISYGDAKVEPFDFTDYDTIVFDEVCFSGAF